MIDARLQSYITIAVAFYVRPEAKGAELYPVLYLEPVSADNLSLEA
jgi:hypothetical protein